MTRDLLDPDSLDPDSWGDHTRRGVEVLGVSGRSLGSCPPLVRSMGLVKIATARANGEAGVLDPEVADALVAAATDLAAAASTPPSCRPICSPAAVRSRCT